jgi:hypothetical protein
LRNSIVARTTIEASDGGALYADAAVVDVDAVRAVSREWRRPERRGSAAILFPESTEIRTPNVVPEAVWGLLVVTWLQTRFGLVHDGRHLLLDQLLREVLAANLVMVLQADLVETGKPGLAVFGSARRLRELAGGLPETMSLAESIAGFWGEGLTLSLTG